MYLPCTVSRVDRALEGGECGVCARSAARPTKIRGAIILASQIKNKLRSTMPRHDIDDFSLTNRLNHHHLANTTLLC